MSNRTTTTPDGLRPCRICGELKPVEYFYLAKTGYRHSWCDPCRRTRAAVHHRKTYDRARNTTSVKRSREALRKETYAAYGDACACCGECDWIFLSLDHVNNDGAEHRRSLGSPNNVGGHNMYRIAKKAGYPDTFQLLCFNCNLGKYRNGGTCPHALTEE